MDPISRESSPSYLPIAGLIAGLVGLLLGGIALANASKAGKAAGDAKVAAEAQTEKISNLEASVAAANTSAENIGRNFGTLRSSTQENFNLVATEIGKVNGEIVKLQEAVSKSAGSRTAAAGGAATARPAGPVTAGPDEYVIKSGDTFSKISRANGVSLADLQAVNPGVDSNKLRVGQKIKLPKK